MGIGYVTNEADVGLPPLQESRKAVWDYYRIEFLPSGYPGRRHGGELQAHPLYGTYVISDYLAQYRATKDLSFLTAAQRVADEALDQMVSVGDGLAFMYSPVRTGVSLRQHDFYSGLTQARYLEVLTKLQRASGSDKYSEAISLVLASLTVRAEEGGVASYGASGGLIIEEYPSAIPDFTLNGWTTATTILSSVEQLDTTSESADVFRASVKGLEEYIADYDVPELANSRYRLTGPAELFVDSSNGLFRITEASVEMPGFGDFEALRVGDPGAASKGSIHAKIGDTKMPQLARSAHFVVQLTRASWPRRNRVSLEIEAAEESRVTISIGVGDYNPLKAAIDVDSTRAVRDVALRPGLNWVDFEIPWHLAELIAYPTNFRKRIAERQFNQYHYIHVDTLRKITDNLRSPILEYFAERWADYPAKWPQLAPYQDSGRRIIFEQFDAKKHK